jgi:pimeloyl-ACP methyl ester carboxylesterase
MRPRFFIAALGLAALSCTRHATLERAGEAHDASAPAGELALVDAGDDAHADAGLRPPLAGFPEQVELTDGTEKVGVVSVPLGARERRPVLIALHGGSEKPERACAAWRGVMDGYAFVVCPRGFGGRESALGWRTPADTTDRIERALGAARKTFGSWILETSSYVLVGFSMGGSQVALVARSDPRRFRRIVVGDSAHDPAPANTFSRTWVPGGGERAIFLCTTSGCEPSLRSAARKVAANGAPARLNVAPTQVHGLSELAVQSMRRDWPWLVEGAEGWATYVSADATTPPGTTETFEPK